MTKVIGVRLPERFISLHRESIRIFRKEIMLLLRQQGALNMAMLFLEYVMLNMRRLYSL